VHVHIVGTAKAKDLILGWAQEGGRVRLAGKGPGRMHWYDGVRADFYEQMLSEIKIPSRTNPRRRAWKARTDRRNEALDCTVYALYLSRHLRLHVRKQGEWDLDELRIRQGTLIDGEAVRVEEEAPVDHFPDATEMVETSAPAPEVDDDIPAPVADPSAVLAEAQALARFRSMMTTRRARYG